MISVYHLIWIIPLSAVAGIIFAVWIVLVDDCLWWADNKSEKKGGGTNDYTGRA